MVTYSENFNAFALCTALPSFEKVCYFCRELLVGKCVGSRNLANTQIVRCKRTACRGGEWLRKPECLQANDLTYCLIKIFINNVKSK